MPSESGQHVVWATDALMTAIRARGYCAQPRRFGTLDAVEAATWDEEHKCLTVPLIRAIRSDRGAWVLTAFFETAVVVPDAATLPDVVVDMLREMDGCATMPTAVIERYKLAPIDPSELDIGDC